MPGHYTCEAGLCVRKEGVFSTATHSFESYFKALCNYEHCRRVWDEPETPLVCFVRLLGQSSPRFFPFPLPTLLTLFYPNPGWWH